MIYGSWDINCNRQIFFCHLGPLFELWKYHKNQNNPWRYNILHKCTKNHDHRLYCSWDMAHDGCNCYFHFGLFFAILPPNSPKNENFKKMKKMLADIIIIHKRTKTRDHMLYCYWDMVRDRCNCYFWFWPIFCPFTPLTAWKTKIKKKKKKKSPGDIIILHKCTKNHDYMLYHSWDMVHDGCHCYFSFWAIFCHFTPLTARKIKISK